MNKRKRKAKREATKQYNRNLAVQVAIDSMNKRLATNLRIFSKISQNSVSKRAIKYRVDIINHG